MLTSVQLCAAMPQIITPLCRRSFTSPLVQQFPTLANQALYWGLTPRGHGLWATDRPWCNGLLSNLPSEGMAMEGCPCFEKCAAMVERIAVALSFGARERCLPMNNTYTGDTRRISD